jgi:predicted RNA-binding protein with TRAM domain
VSKRNVSFNSGKFSRRSKTAGRSVPSVTDRFSAIVRDVSSDGKGVVEAPDGQVLFVAGVWPGEELQLTRKRTGRDGQRSRRRDFRGFTKPDTATMRITQLRRLWWLSMDVCGLRRSS